MRFSKKSLISASLAVIMAAGCITVPVVASAAGDSQASASENQNTAYNLASSVEDGNILHAFNWYFKQDLQQFRFLLFRQIRPQLTRQPMPATGGLHISR